MFKKKKKDYRYHLDLPKKSGLLLSADGSLHVGGWFFDSKGRPAKRIVLNIGDNAVKCSSFNRPDVQSSFEGELEVSMGCGFWGWLKFGKGLKLLKIKAVLADGEERVLDSILIYSTKGANDEPGAEALHLAAVEKYRKWVEEIDTLDDGDRESIKKHLNGCDKQPLISVVMPVYNPPERFLREVIDSVRNQLYENWEFCISDDNSSKPYVRSILEEYEKLDPRIRVVYRKENGHIAHSSNSAIEIAKGEYMALLDHDDLLPEHALALVVDEINKYPDAKLIYSDEDKIDIGGNRLDPYFKSDWNRDLLLGHNCVSHLGVYQIELVRKIGGFRHDFVGAQDWDLALRMVEQLKESEIRHIPHVLYHWRVFEESTAMNIESKPYAIEAGKNAIQGHLDRRGDNAIAIEGKWHGSFRVIYGLEKEPLVSVIIPTCDQLAFLSTCVTSLLEDTAYDNLEIIIVNNNSKEKNTFAYLDLLKDNPRIRVLDFEGEFNFSAINNFAVKQCRGELLCFLNNDIEVIDSGWLREMVSHAIRPDVGVVGARLFYPQQILQHAGIIAGVCGVAGHAFRGGDRNFMGHHGRAYLIQQYSAVTGACMVTPKDLFLSLGGFNEENLGVAYNDVDYCFKSRASGRKVIWTPYTELLHHESISRGYEDTDEKKERLSKEQDYMFENWGDIIAWDPAYNPNLTLEKEDFDFAFPSRAPKFWK